MSENDQNYKLYEEWREKQRKQVSNVTSLYLALSTAILGFVVNYISKTQINFCCKAFLKVGIIFLLLSISSALLLALNRLVDFRKTASLYDQDKTTKEVSKETKCLGDITWFLIRSQIILFAFGMIILVITFSLIL